MSKNLVISLSDDEVQLIHDIRDLSYGELHDVKVELEEYETNFDVSGKEYNFIMGLREEGSFDVVVIHDAEPVSAQKADLTLSGRDCIAKTRF